jgi:hypothetical protein
MRTLLEKELNKFTHVSPSVQAYPRHYRMPSDCVVSPHNPINPKYSSRGQVNLRRLIEEVCNRLPKEYEHPDIPTSLHPYINTSTLPASKRA